MRINLPDLSLVDQGARLEPLESFISNGHESIPVLL